MSDKCWTKFESFIVLIAIKFVLKHAKYFYKCIILNNYLANNNERIRHIFLTMNMKKVTLKVSCRFVRQTIIGIAAFLLTNKITVILSSMYIQFVICFSQFNLFHLGI